MTEFAANPPLEHAAALRRTSDDFMERLDQLHQLELRKRELPPDESEFIRLAREIETLARGLLYSGSQQVELAEEVHYEAQQSDASVDASIRETPPRRDAVTVLAEWRAAERQLAAAAIGSEDEAAARTETERLRKEYRQLTAPEEPAPGDA